MQRKTPTAWLVVLNTSAHQYSCSQLTEAWTGICYNLPIRRLSEGMYNAIVIYGKRWTKWWRYLRILLFVWPQERPWTYPCNLITGYLHQSYHEDSLKTEKLTYSEGESEPSHPSRIVCRSLLRILVELKIANILCKHRVNRSSPLSCYHWVACHFRIRTLQVRFGLSI